MTKLISSDKTSNNSPDERNVDKFTILNVDDDDAGRYAIGRILQKAGFAVKEAATGRQALEMAGKIMPDLVLLDVHLPDISGFEVCKMLKADPATALIPVLHLSATYMDSHSRVAGLEGGADAYLTHPVEPPVLIATIKALLRMHQAETRVVTAARKWQITFDTISDGVCLLDEEGKIVQCNQAMIKLLDKPPDEITGKKCGELIGCEKLDSEGACYQHLRETGRRESFDWQFHDRWFHMSLDPVMDEAGLFSGAVQIITDITLEKRSQEERERLYRLLEAEQSRLEAVVQQMPAGVSIAEAPSGKLVLSNEQVEKIWRHPPLKSASIEQYSEWKGFHPDGRPYQHEEWPLARSIRTGEVVMNEEIAILRGDGSCGTISISSAPIRDRDGQIVAGVVTISDITERRKVELELERYHHHLEELVKERTSDLMAANEKLRQEIEERRRAEEKLRESELKYSTVVEQARDWVVIVQDGVFQFSNQAVTCLTGYSVEEILGRPLLDIIAPEYRNLVAERYALRSVGKDVPSPCEVKIQAKDGAVKDAEISAGTIQYQARPATVIIIRDITERKRLEEERQRAERLESIGILAGGIAHDFNNILTSIIGNISLARMYAKSESRIHGLLTETEKSSFQARDLTQQLLTFSKGGAPVKKTASIRELLREVSTFALRGSRVKAEFFLAEDLWPVEVDTGQISQVINNLVINAKQAMPDGGIVRVTAENVTMGPGSENDTPLLAGKYIRISVEDQGSGIPAEHLQNIFDPYFTTKEKGSGLGLATSYSIIRKHDGYINVRSRLGVGTVFTMYLPAVPEKAAAVSETRTFPASFRRGQGKVLVMDDETTVRNVVTHMLRFLGYEAEAAIDGNEAIDLYKKARESGHPFDAVIMDLTVQGGMGGEQAIQKMHEIDPGVRAIVSSGYSNDAILADFRRAGFSGIIAKPYKVEELAEVLHQVIGGKK
ncbi:MAG: PAS domain S-box protein [bacterium]